MNTDHMFKKVAAAAAAIGGLIANGAICQPYPSRPIRLIVPFAAGGPTDVVARIIAQKLGENMAQQVVVDNRAGATTIIGTEMGAKAAPDGYTLLMIAASHSITPSLYPKLPYNLVRDFAPVTLATAGPFLMVINPSIRADNVAEFVALAKSKPGEFTSGSSGTGSTAHMALELLNYIAGTRIRHVPYKGAPQGLADLLGGQISMYFGGVPGLLPHVKAGKLKGLAVSTRTRSMAAPNIPTIAEAGISGYEVSGWYGIVAPAGTSKSIITRLNAAIVALLQTQDIKEKMAANGAESVASTPEEFRVYVAAEISKWEKVIKASGIKVE